MTRRSLGGVSALILVAGAVLSYLFLFADDAPVAAPEPLDTAKVVGDQTVAPKRVSSDAPPAASPAMLTDVIDPDPEGPLRLEGQVLGPQDSPIGGAIVTLDSNPPRTAVTEDDGSFAFDNLVGKTYGLAARSDDLVGGPVVHQLSDSSDPAVVRLRQGARVDVEVVSALDGSPVADAMVTLLGASRLSEMTDGSGSARLRGAAPGFVALKVSASGFATQTVMMRIPESAADATRQRVELEPGVIIAGKVVDPSGAPVEGATVRAVAVGNLMGSTVGGSRDNPIETDAAGAFKLPGVGMGDYRFTATHTKFAPGSSPPIEVGPSGPGQDILITLEPGGVVAGLVVDSKGAPAPWAAVRLTAAAEENGQPGHQRQTVAGDDGRFRLEGVSRGRLTAVASTDAAASELVDVDLETRDAAEDVTLALSLEGTITGTVTDGQGEPLAEAQVVALPDFWAGEDLEDMQHRGPAFATTDGGGRFALRGLAEGKKFQLRAARSELDAATWQKKGVGAQTGDTGVKLVVPKDGAVIGKLRSSDGSVPEVAMVSVGWASSAPAVKGSFELPAVPPGTYDVTVRGADFPEAIVSDVEIEPGKTADLGTIELAAGRKVAGQVVDASGRAVAGADVVLARQLVGDGRNLTASGLGPAFEQQTGMRRASTDGSGRFVFKGVGMGDLVVAAEETTRGRSLPAAVGTADAQNLALRLQPFGGIEGTVTKDGKPAGGAQVLVTSPANEKQIVVVNAGPDGAFAVERIGAGEYTVVARAGLMGGAKASTRVSVAANTRTDASIDIRTGNKTLLVTVVGRDGAQVDSAQVFVFEGEASATVASEINRIYLSAAGWADMQFAQSKANVPATFRKVPEGQFTACVLPITGDLSDPTFAQRLSRHTDTLKVYCEPLEVAASPDEQAVTRAVPAMDPLPED